MLLGLDIVSVANVYPKLALGQMIADMEAIHQLSAMDVMEVTCVGSLSRPLNGQHALTHNGNCPSPGTEFICLSAEAVRLFDRPVKRSRQNVVLK